MIKIQCPYCERAISKSSIKEHIRHQHEGKPETGFDIRVIMDNGELMTEKAPEVKVPEAMPVVTPDVIAPEVKIEPVIDNVALQQIELKRIADELKLKELDLKESGDTKPAKGKNFLDDFCDWLDSDTL